MSLKCILGPLPDLLRIGVYDSYEKRLYRQFMQRVVALQEGTMSLEKVEDDVFHILGYEGGKMDRGGGYQPTRDATSKSHRPDLYRMFVEWSNGVSPVVGKKKKKSVPFSFGVIVLPTTPLKTTPPKRMCLQNRSRSSSEMSRVGHEQRAKRPTDV
jgi:hypothetical protein